MRRAIGSIRDERKLPFEAVKGTREGNNRTEGKSDPSRRGTASGFVRRLARVRSLLDAAS